MVKEETDNSANNTERQDDWQDESEELYPLTASQEETFQEATLVATIAETFGLTRFKPFQKDISSVLDGKDTVVIQPTGGFVISQNKMVALVWKYREPLVVVHYDSIYKIKKGPR